MEELFGGKVPIAGKLKGLQGSPKILSDVSLKEKEVLMKAKFGITQKDKKFDIFPKKDKKFDMFLKKDKKSKNLGFNPMSITMPPEQTAKYYQKVQYYAGNNQPSIDIKEKMNLYTPTRNNSNAVNLMNMIVNKTKNNKDNINLPKGMFAGFNNKKFLNAIAAKGFDKTATEGRNITFKRVLEKPTFTKVLHRPKILYDRHSKRMTYGDEQELNPIMGDPNLLTVSYDETTVDTPAKKKAKPKPGYSYVTQPADVYTAPDTLMDVSYSAPVPTTVTTEMPQSETTEATETTGSYVKIGGQPATEYLGEAASTVGQKLKGAGTYLKGLYEGTEFAQRQQLKKEGKELKKEAISDLYKDPAFRKEYKERMLDQANAAREAEIRRLTGEERMVPVRTADGKLIQVRESELKYFTTTQGSPESKGSKFARFIRASDRALGLGKRTFLDEQKITNVIGQKGGVGIGPGFMATAGSGYSQTPFPLKVAGLTGDTRMLQDLTPLDIAKYKAIYEYKSAGKLGADAVPIKIVGKDKAVVTKRRPAAVSTRQPARQISTKQHQEQEYVDDKGNKIKIKDGIKYVQPPGQDKWWNAKYKYWLGEGAEPKGSYDKRAPQVTTAPVDDYGNVGQYGQTKQLEADITEIEQMYVTK